MAFEIGQKVRDVRTRLAGFFGTVHEVRQVNGETRYQVGGVLDEDEDEVWSADFHADELESS